MHCITMPVSIAAACQCRYAVMVTGGAAIDVPFLSIVCSQSTACIPDPCRSVPCLVRGNIRACTTLTEVIQGKQHLP